MSKLSVQCLMKNRSTKDIATVAMLQSFMLSVSDLVIITCCCPKPCLDAKLCALMLNLTPARALSTDRETSETLYTLYTLKPET